MSERKEKFTPGPWSMDSIDTPFQLAYGEVIGGDDSGNRDVRANEGQSLIAVLYGDGVLPQTANAHLIAAAPELYEALVGVLRVADRQTVEFDAARAALAKARGES